MINKFILPKKDRSFGLDTLRASAILMVLIYHAWIFVAGFFPKAGLLFFLGYWGVELFFVLSGFLIGGILIEKIYSTTKLSFDDVLSFWKKRWIRTIPIYLIVLLINYLSINYIIQQPTNFDFRYLIFIQNLFSVHPKFFPEVWSLAIEEWFYLCLPLFFMLGFTIPTKNKTIRIFSVLLILLTLFTFLRFLKLESSFDIVKWDREVRKVVIFRLDALLYGVLAALLYRFKKAEIIKHKNNLFVLGLLLVTVAYFLFFKKYSALFNVVFFSSTTSLGFAFLVLCFKDWSGFSSIRIRNSIGFISVISYSLYLIHYSFLFRLFNKFFIAKTISHSIMLSLIYIFVAILLASIIHLLFEKPFLKMKEKMN